MNYSYSSYLVLNAPSVQLSGVSLLYFYFTKEEEEEEELLINSQTAIARGEKTRESKGKTIQTNLRTRKEDSEEARRRSSEELRPRSRVDGLGRGHVAVVLVAVDNRSNTGKHEQGTTTTTTTSL